VAVYVIQAGDNGPVKIGYTSGSVEKRVASLQTGNPQKLKIVKVYEDGCERLKADMHAAHQKHRLVGEWFSPSVLDEILAGDNYLRCPKCGGFNVGRFSLDQGQHEGDIAKLGFLCCSCDTVFYISYITGSGKCEVVVAWEEKAKKTAP